MKRSLLALLASVATTSFGEVKMTGEKPVVDGRLDDSCWAEATWNGGFVRLANSVKDRSVRAQTSFAIVADARTLYVVVRCDEPDMPALKARPPSAPYICDEIELFLSPRGDGFDCYQFVVPFDPRNGSAVRYASEGGNISPDPYGPDWTFARGECDGGWCVEMAIPLSSLYMTRNVQWRDEWRVNVARMGFVGGTLLTTWSPLQTKFVEPSNFRAMKGFPKRLDADDVGITGVIAEMSGNKGGRPSGTLSFVATVEQGGEYEVSSPHVTATSVRLKHGSNSVRVPCTYPANGRHMTRIALTRKASGETYARTYPVVVDFEPMRLFLSEPEYRGNFYPGQDASRVKGRIETACAGEVLVTLEGPGFPKREARLPQGGGEIDFDTRGFQEGTAVLAMSVGAEKREFKIRKLAKTGRRMTWISKGRLVVDGKPVLRRGIYAQGYMGGKAFADRFAADDHLSLTPEVCGGGTLEPGRVVNGLESREARRDVMPCREYFDKIDALIEKSRDRDFAYWYISDEPECRGISQVYLRHVYEYVKEKDPYHVVLTATRAGKRYMDCADWFETHPYLNPHDDGKGNRVLDIPPAKIGEYVDAFGAGDRPDKCVGFLPTMFAYRGASILNDYPTFPEYVCHVWAAMMRGAKTLFPYAYHDMGDRASIYEGNCYVNSSMEALGDFILDGRRTTLLKTPEAECVRWDLDSGESMFALANFTAERLALALPRELADRKWHQFRGQWSDGRALKPYEVVVGTTSERGRGLSTYAEVKAIVDKAEHERTHRDSQILEKYMELGFASSNGKTRFHKLVDGTRDMLGWFAKGKDPWVEFSFAGKPVRFSRVRVYGSGIDGMKVAVRKGGEWKELRPASVKSERYMRELDFGGIEKTVKMRISFPVAKGISDVELYEVEIPRVNDTPVNPGETTCGAASQGEDTDALWRFDASNAEWSDAKCSTRMWYGGETNPGVVPRMDGGFTVFGRTLHAVRLDPAYPWIELEVDSFASRQARAYRAWWLRFHKNGGLVGTVTNPQTGLYVVKVPQIEKPQGDYVVFDDYNLEIGVKRLCNVRRPANFAIAEAAGGEGAIKPGSILNVTLELAASCADVTAMLLVDHGKGAGFVGFPVNGTNAIELKPADGCCRVWKAAIPVKSCGIAAARKVYAKFIVLGGSLKTPLFTTINQPFG